MKTQIEIKETEDSKIAMFSIHIEDMPVEDYQRLSELPNHIEKAVQDFFYMKTGKEIQDCLKLIIERNRPSNSGIF